MEEFLTPRAKNRIWEIPLAAFLLLFAAAGIGVLMDDITYGSDATGLTVDLVLLFLLIFPVYRMVRRRLSVGEARKIAGALSSVPGDRITFAQLQKEAAVTGRIDLKLRNLMDRKFLKAVDVSYSESLIRLTSPERIRKREAEESSTFVVECASCGAKQIVKRGIRAKCEYCGSPLKTD